MRAALLLGLFVSCSGSPAFTRPMIELGENVFAEPTLTDPEKRELELDYKNAQKSLVEAFGTPRGQPPLTIFCHTAACKIEFGADPESASGSSLGFARDGYPSKSGWVKRPTVIVSGPYSRTELVLLHELVHAEMKAWLPYDSLPTWFNEGVAAWLAGEPVCTDSPSLSSDEVMQLDSKAKWQAWIRGGRTLIAYCAAREQIASWSAQFPDRRAFSAALRKLMTSVANGTPFAQAFAAR